MQPPLSKRIGLVDPSVEVREDGGAMARSLMYLFALGGLVALLALAGSPQGALPRLGASAALAWGAASLLLASYDTTPSWCLQLLVAAGAALVDWSVAASGHAGTGCALLLTGGAIYSVYYFTKLQAAAQLLLIAGGYAAAASLGAHAGPGRLLVTAAGFAACTGLVGLHRASANRLIWRLADVARTDPLTGLLNRRGFEELIETELERSRRSGNPLSLIVGDLDHFKRLNDRYGHAAGDSALERLSLILQTAKRRIDTAARIGGEEFAVIIPDSDRHAAFILAERMRREVRETFAHEPYELTISLGVATFPVHAANVEALVARADESLYAAKALGRDRTVVYHDELGDSVFTGGSASTSDRNVGTVLALAGVFHDRESGRDTHSQTVGRYSAALARELGLGSELVERIRVGGIVHDIGKIGISDHVLRKVGWLSAEDWIELRRHPEIGAQILDGVELHDVGEWVRAHHERPDGTGYPDGLHGPDIPIEARILAVADAYEAMTSDRVYRSALSPEEARAELARGAGSQFDRRVVDAFMRVLDTGRDRLPLEPRLEAPDAAPDARRFTPSD